MTRKFSLVTSTIALASLAAVFLAMPAAYADPINPSFSQYSVTVGLGQSITIVSQGSSTGVYLSSNSNSAIATVQTSGTQVVVTGVQVGSGTASICFVGTASNCTTLTITVQIAPVAIATSTTSSSGSISFGQSSPSLGIGQTIAVTISGGTAYYIAANTNAGVVSAAVNGSVVTITGLVGGSTSINVCSVENNCGTLSVSVSSSGYVSPSSTTSGQSSLSFGVTSPTVAIGQTLSVAISGGSNYFVSSNPSPNIVQASVNGNSLMLVGVNTGSASVTVCASSGGCGTLPTTVNTTGSSASVPVVVPVPAVSGSATTAALLAQISAMQSQLMQIIAAVQAMQSQLGQLVAGIGKTITSAIPGSAPSASGLYQFLKPFGLGSAGADVTALQQWLTAKGFYSGSITGFFGSLTESALKKYQTAHGIPAQGNVGPSTQAALNAGE